MSRSGVETDRRRVKSRRLMRLAFNVHVPAWVLSEAFRKLPEDCMIVKCAVDDIENFQSSIFLWSNEFKEVPESCRVPELQIMATDDGTVELQTWNQVLSKWKSCRFK